MHLKYIVPTGSIAIDGTSLKVCEVNVKEGWFDFIVDREEDQLGRESLRVREPVYDTEKKHYIPKKAEGEEVRLTVFKPRHENIGDGQGRRLSPESKEVSKVVTAIQAFSPWERNGAKRLLEALQDAGLVRGNSGAPPPAGAAAENWKLPEELRDSTGVVYASSYPGLDAAVAEVSKGGCPSFVISRLVAAPTT